MAMQLQPDVEQGIQVWQQIRPILFVPRTEDEYHRLVNVLKQLIDLVGNDESHPLASLMDVIGTLVEQYEDAHVPAPSWLNP